MKESKTQRDGGHQGDEAFSTQQNNVYANPQRLAAHTGLHGPGPGGVPALGGEVDISPIYNS